MQGCVILQGREGYQGEREGDISKGGYNNSENFGGIEFWGGGLSMYFVVIAGAAGQKGKHGRFLLGCVISCDNTILTHLLLERVEKELG